VGPRYPQTELQVKVSSKYILGYSWKLQSVGKGQNNTRIAGQGRNRFEEPVQALLMPGFYSSVFLVPNRQE
jgi:3'-phosphoadenosine 5'-phosphosulfate sulfotransferase